MESVNEHKQEPNTEENIIKQITLEKNEPIYTGFDTIVLAGGSSKGILTLGALQYTYDNYLIKNVQTYIGTSSGAIISYLLAIGYSPIEIIVYICTHQLMEKLQHFNVVAMINGSGASSFVNIHEQLEKMTIKKIGFLPTLQELKTKFGKTLICVTHNLTESRTEYLKHETHPNLPCLTAIRMSANLPLIFETYKYGNNFYIDGGISDNFPINIGDTMGTKILGISLQNNENKSGYDPEMNILEYIYNLMFIPISQSCEYKLSQTSEKCKIVKLSYNKIKFFNFNLNSNQKLDLFSSGYQQMKKSLE